MDNPAVRSPILTDNLVVMCFTVHNIAISVPLNTGAIGGIITRENIVVPTDISFNDLFSRLCAKMDLDPQGAILGYKFNRDLRRAPYTELKGEDDLHVAMARGVDLIERARKRVVVLEIQNMVSLLFVLSLDCALMSCAATGS